VELLSKRKHTDRDLWHLPCLPKLFQGRMWVKAGSPPTAPHSSRSGT